MPATELSPHRKPALLILDTDMGNDVDDALALAMIHTLEARGECQLLGVTVSKDHPLAGPCVEAINAFYGRDDVPVARVRDGVTPEEGRFNRAIVERFPAVSRGAAGRQAETTDAVTLLRRVLGRAEDRSITIVMIGFSTNLARLLASEPDASSPLGGHELFARKVASVVMMAGDFSPAGLADIEAQNPEFNVRLDVASAQAFVHDCPAPIVFSGWEVGAAVTFPGEAVTTRFRWAQPHPVAEAYRLYQPMPYDRPSWDQTAVLHAVRGDASGFAESPRGRVVVDDRGRVRFTPDAAGPHRYLALASHDVPAVRQEIVDLCVAPSAGGPWTRAVVRGLQARPLPRSLTTVPLQGARPAL